MKTKAMKKSLLAIVITIILTGFVNAQSPQEEVDLYQSVFGMEKKAMITDFMGQNTNDAFWSIYDEYESKRKVLGQDRLALLLDYAEVYETINDDDADALVKAMESQKKSLDKLISIYTKKVKKATGSIAAAQFYQFENYLLAAVRMKIMDEIPLIGELDVQF